MLAHHFSHYYSRKCRRMVLEVTSVISPSVPREILGIYTQSRSLCFTRPNQLHDDIYLLFNCGIFCKFLYMDQHFSLKSWSLSLNHLSAAIYTHRVSGPVLGIYNSADNLAVGLNQELSYTVGICELRKLTFQNSKSQLRCKSYRSKRRGPFL